MTTSTKPQKILIAINLTDASRRAFYAALDLAAHYGAETWVLHVAEPIRAYDIGKRRYIESQETIERVEEGVHKRIDELWAEGGHESVDRRKVHVLVRGGAAHEEIVATAEAKGIELIVMGAGGSTTERVARNAQCSVFAVR